MLLHHSPSPPRHALKCRAILAEDFICPHDGHYAHLGGATFALGSCGYTSWRISSLTSPCPPVHALLCLGMLLLEISFQHFSKLLIPYVASLWPCHTFLWLIKVFSAPNTFPHLHRNSFTASLCILLNILNRPPTYISSSSPVSCTSNHSWSPVSRCSSVSPHISWFPSLLS